MSARLLQPTEQTTGSPAALELVGRLTPNHPCGRSFEFGPEATVDGFAPSIDDWRDSEAADLRPSCNPVSDQARASMAKWIDGVVVNDVLPRVKLDWIDDLGEAGYHVLRRIPVEIRRVDIGDFEASFRAANIAISGSDSNDALQALVVEILDTFDVLLEEHRLGRDAAVQRRTLRRYIART